MQSKKFYVLAAVCVLAALLATSGSGALAQGGQPPYSPAGGSGFAFTYQGQLKFNNAPHDGVCDFQFSSFDAVTEGNNKGTQDKSAVTVSKGLFTVELGYALGGQQIWLEIGVRCPAGSGSYTTLTPRQMVTSVPYAISIVPGSETDGIYSGAFSSYARFATTSEGLHGGVWGGKYGVHGASPSVGTNLGKAGVLGTTSWGTVNDVPAEYNYYDAGGLFIGPNGVIAVASQESKYGDGVVGLTYGAYGKGVVGKVMTTTGTNYGVQGSTLSPNGAGVYGEGAGVGVRGTTSGVDAWAGAFETDYGNGVYVSAPAGKAGLIVASGTKNAVVSTNQGSRLLYTEESSEVWFTDYGFGQLKNGAAIIVIDPLFAQTVNLAEPYHVFAQSYGEAELYVSRRTPTQFEVKARSGGDLNVEFSYRLVAKRLGYEASRLAPAPWADSDPNLYPAKRGQLGASDKATNSGTPGFAPEPVNGQGR